MKARRVGRHEGLVLVVIARGGGLREAEALRIKGNKIKKAKDRPMARGLLEHKGRRGGGGDL